MKFKKDVEQKPDMRASGTLTSVLDTIFSPGFKPVNCNSRRFNVLDYIGIPVVGHKSDGKQEYLELKSEHQTRICYKSKNANHQSVQIRLSDLDKKAELRKLASLETSGYHVVKLKDYQRTPTEPLDINANIINESGVPSLSGDGDAANLTNDGNYSLTQDVALLPQITKVESLSEISFELLDNPALEHLDLSTEQLDTDRAEEADPAFKNNQFVKQENGDSDTLKQSEDNTACLSRPYDETSDLLISEIQQTIDTLPVPIQQLNNNFDNSEKLNAINCSDFCGDFEIYIDIDSVQEQTATCKDPTDKLFSPDSDYGTDQSEQVCLNDTIDRANDKIKPVHQYSAFGFDINEAEPTANVNESSDEITNSTDITEALTGNISSEVENINKKKFNHITSETAIKKKGLVYANKAKTLDSKSHECVTNANEMAAEKRHMNNRAHKHKTDSSKAKLNSKHEVMKDSKKVNSTKVCMKHANKSTDCAVSNNWHQEECADETESAIKVTENTNEMTMQSIKTSSADTQSNNEANKSVYGSDKIDICVNKYENSEEQNTSLNMLKSTVTSKHGKGKKDESTSQKNIENGTDKCLKLQQNQEQKSRNPDSSVKKVCANQKGKTDQIAEVHAESELKSNKKIALQVESHNKIEKSKSSLKSSNTLTGKKSDAPYSKEVESDKTVRSSSHKNKKKEISESNDKTEPISFEHNSKSYPVQKKRKDGNENKSNIKSKTETEKKDIEVKDIQLNHEKIVKEKRQDCVGVAKVNLNRGKNHVLGRKKSCSSDRKNTSFQPEKNKNESDLNESEQSMHKALKGEKARSKALPLSKDTVEAKIHNLDSIAPQKQIECTRKDTGEECQEKQINKTKPKKRKLSSIEIMDREAKKRVIEWLEHHVLDSVIDKEPDDNILKPTVSQMKFKIPKRVKQTEPEKNHKCKDCENVSFQSKELLHDHIETEHKQKREDKSKSHIFSAHFDKRSSQEIKDQRTSVNKFKCLHSNIATDKHRYRLSEKVKENRHGRKSSTDNNTESDNTSHKHREQNQHSENKYVKGKNRTEDNNKSEKTNKLNISKSSKGAEIVKDERSNRTTDNKISRKESLTDPNVLVTTSENGKERHVSENCTSAFDNKSKLMQHKDLQHNNHAETKINVLPDISCDQENSGHISSNATRSNRFNESKCDKRLKDDIKTSDKCETTIQKEKFLCDGTQIPITGGNQNTDKKPEILSNGNSSRDKPDENERKIGRQETKTTCLTENEDIIKVKNTYSDSIITKGTKPQVNVSQSEGIDAERNHINDKRSMYKCGLSERSGLIQHEYLKHSDKNGKSHVFNFSERKRRNTKYDCSEFSQAKWRREENGRYYERDQYKKNKTLKTSQDSDISIFPNRVNTQNTVKKEEQVATSDKLTNVNTQSGSSVNSVSTKTNSKHETFKPLLSLDVTPTTTVKEIVQQMQVGEETKGETTERCNICKMIFFHGSMQSHFRIAHPEKTYNKFTSSETVCSPERKGTGNGRNVHPMDLDSLARTKLSKGVKPPMKTCRVNFGMSHPPNHNHADDGNYMIENSAKNDERSAGRPYKKTHILSKGTQNKSK